MSRVASGYYTGSPSEYLVYTNVVIGKVLKTLYTYEQNIDWYSVYLYSIHFLSMWFLLVLLLRAKTSPGLLAIIFFLILFAFFELRFLVRVQFTTTAAVSGITGLLLVCSEAINERKSVFLNVAGVFLIFLSFLCRSSACYLVTILLVPLVFYSLYYRYSRLFIGTLAASALLCFTAGIYNYYSYQSNFGWKKFAEYNYYRSRLHGFPILYDLKNNEIDLSELGWTQNDLSMFRNWHYTNKEVYSVDKLKKLIEIYSNLPEEEHEKYGLGTWYQTMKEHSQLLKNYGMFLVLIILIFAFSRMITSHAMAVTGSTLVLSLLLLLCLGYIGRLVERVSLPILYGVSLVFCYMALNSVSGMNEKIVGIFHRIKNWVKSSGVRSEKEKGSASPAELPEPSVPRRSFLLWIRIVVVAVLVMITGTQLQDQFSKVRQLSRKNENREVTYNRLLEGYDTVFREMKIDPTLISWGGYIPLGWQKPFQIYPILKDLKIINLGWATHSPNYDESLQRSEIVNIDLALLNRDDVFICCREDFIKYYRGYLKEKYGFYIIKEKIGEDVFDKLGISRFDITNIFRLRIDPRFKKS